MFCRDRRPDCPYCSGIESGTVEDACPYIIIIIIMNMKMENRAARFSSLFIKILLPPRPTDGMHTAMRQANR